MKNWQKIIKNSLLLTILTFNIVGMLIVMENSIDPDSEGLILDLLNGFSYHPESKNKENYIVPILTVENIDKSPIKESEMDFNNPFNAKLANKFTVTGVADFTYRKNITIEASQVAADLTNYALLLDLKNQPDVFGATQYSGNDIAFTDSSNNQLDHEIELFDRSTSHLVVWIRIPTLSSSVDTLILMYYGNSTIESQENVEGVWDSNYAGVWHFNDDPSGTVYDSTSNNNDGTSYGSVMHVTGMTGNAYHLDQLDATDDYIQIADSNSLDITGEEITLEGWIYLTETPVPLDTHIIHKANVDYESQGYLMGVDGETFLTGEGSPTKLNQRIVTDIDGYKRVDYGTIYPGEWTYLTVTYNGSIFAGYIDSSNVYSESWTGNIVNTTGEDLYFGLRGSGDTFIGILDELRISDSSRSEAYISTTYNNLNDPESFYTIGYQEPISLEGYKYSRSITIDSSVVSGGSDLSNFSIMLDLYLEKPVGSLLVLDQITRVAYDYEVELYDENYNSTTSHVVLWVRIPTLSASLDTEIELHYGNTGSLKDFNSDNLWIDYLGVWHFSEEVTNNQESYGTYVDSSPSSIDGNQHRTDDFDGLIGNSQNFDGSNDYIEMGDNFDILDTEDGAPGDSYVTISGWFIRDTTSTIDTIVEKADNDAPGVGYGDENYITGYSIYIDNSDGLLHVIVGDNDDDGFQIQSTSNFNTLPIDWYHFAVMFNTAGDTNSLKIFIDGVDVSGTISAYGNGGSYDGNGFNVDDNFTIGAKSNTSEYFDGKIDEIRFRDDVSLTADWFKTEYNNQKNFSTYITISSTIENGNWWQNDNYAIRKDIFLDSSQYSDVEEQLVIRSATAGYDYSSQTLTPIGTTYSHEAIDTETDDTSYVHHNINTAGENGVYYFDYYYLEGIPKNPTGTITKVTIYSRSRYSGTPLGAVSFQHYMRLGTQNYWQQGFSLSTSFTWRSTEVTDNPATSSPWTWDDVKDLQLGVRYSASFSDEDSVDIRMSRLYAVVSYTNTDGVQDTPILIDLYDEDLKTKVNSSGGSIIFYDEYGQQLSYELMEFNQTYNSTHAHFQAYLEVPYLSKNHNPLISMYYDTVNSTKSGSIWNDYAGVWHMNEPLSSTVYDNSTNNNDGTSSGNVAFDSSGKIGSSLEFDGTDDYIEIPDDNSLDLSKSITFNAWINPDVTSRWQTIASKLDGTTEDLYVALDNSYVKIGLNPVVLDSTWPSSPTVSSGEWTLVSFTYDGSILELYIDGVLSSSIAGQDSLDLSDNINSLYFGINTGWTTEDWDGFLDEIWLSSEARSSSWMKAVYSAQNSPNTFMTSSNEYDNFGPITTDFNVDDPGDGTATFWANITDKGNNGENDVKIKIEGTTYSMNKNASGLWVYSYSVPNYGDNISYQIVNATDDFGNYIYEVSEVRSKIFDYDTVDPTILQWKYYTLNPENTFIANVTDNWGVIDTVIVNVTSHDVEMPADPTREMDNYIDYGDGNLGFINNTITMENGDITFKVWVNDTKGNWFESSEHLGFVYFNNPPLVENVTIKSSTYNNETILSSHDMYVDYDYFDQDGHGDSGTELRWYRWNGTQYELQSGFNDVSTIPAANISKDEQWYVAVHPKDGNKFGQWNTSSNYTIKNTAPTFTTFALNPQEAYTTSTLSISYTPYDYDGDSIVGYYTKWYNNSVHDPTFNGQLSLSPDDIKKGETWYVKMILYDGIENSTNWEVSSSIKIKNTKPTAINLQISPNPVYTTDDLVASWEISDADGDSEIQSSAIIEWFKYGSHTGLEDRDNETTIPSSYTQKGELWKFRVKIFDGENYSDWVELLAQVEITNTVPGVELVEINGGNINNFTSYDITASWNYTDPDYEDGVDTEQPPQIEWFINGELISTAITLSSSETQKGDIIHFRIRTNDGTNYSNSVNSSTITIINTIPVVTPGSLDLTSSPKTTTDLVATWEASDADTDSLTFYIVWIRDGTNYTSIVTSSFSTTLSYSNTAKGEDWSFSVRAYDSTENSTWETLGAPITILNSIPLVGNLTITNSPTTTDDLVIDWDYSDDDVVDNSSLTFIITWFKNGQEQGGFENYTTIDFSNTYKGEFWWFKVQAWDGEAYSSTPDSDHIEILNTAPVISLVQIYNSNPKTTDELNYTITISDDDSGDTFTYSIMWYINNVHDSQYDNDTSISASETTKGENWKVYVIAKDNQDLSNGYTSLNVQILNTAPVVTPGSLDLTSSPKTTMDLVATWEASDADTDSLTFYIVWIRDGSNYTSVVTTSYSTTLGNSNTIKSEDWSFTVRAYDSTENSTWETLGAPITILNSIPLVGNLTITDSPTTTDDLTADWDYSDDDTSDNSSLAFIITWFKNGQEQGGFENDTTINFSNTNKGEFWWFEVQAWDGEAYSSTPDSDHIEILNTAPVISLVQIYNSNPKTTDELNYTITISDDDSGDMFTYLIMWYINNIHDSQYDNDTSISASETTKGENWKVYVIAKDNQDLSNGYTSLNVLILNTAPKINSNSLALDTNPTTTSNLNASWDSVDVDSDSLTFYIEWYLNGVLNTTITTNSEFSSLNNGNTTKGQKWTFNVKAFDLVENSSWVSLGINVTIINSIPVVLTPTYNNTATTDEPFVAADDYYFNISYTYSDDDGDSQNTSAIYIQWYINSIHNSAYDGYTTIHPDNTTNGQVWRYTIIINDGNENSSETQAVNICVIGSRTNEAPFSTAISISPGTAKTHQTLKPIFTYYDSHDDDLSGLRIWWYQNNVTIKSYWHNGTFSTLDNNSITLPSSYTIKGGVYNYSVQFADIFGAWGSINTSSTLVIINTEPEIIAGSLTITEDPSTSDSITASWDARDNDSDSLTYYIEWFLNGNSYLNTSSTNKNSILQSGNTSKGQDWSFIVTVYDQQVNSSTISLGINITVINTQPVVTSPTIPITPKTIDDLTADWKYTDFDISDNSSLVFYIHWFKNGIKQLGFNNQVTVTADNTLKGQIWWYEVIAYDGEINSSTKESAHIEIINSAPTVSTAEINNTLPQTGDILDAIWKYSDVDISDNSTLIFTIKWYRNDTYMPTYTQFTLPNTATAKNDLWHFSVYANDGSEMSNIINSSQMQIVNTAPDINSGSLILSSNVRTADDLIASWLATDSDPVDTLTYYVTWYLTGVPQFTEYVSTTSTTLQSGNTTKGDEWSFKVRAYDNTENSSWETLGSQITILNTDPLVANLSITSNPQTLDDLSISFDYTDSDPADSSNLEYWIIWYRNGIKIDNLENKSLIENGNTSKTQYWWYQVIINDGESNSTTKESLHIEILNTVPTVDDAVFNNINPKTGDNLIANWKYSDDDLTDNSTLVFTFNWYKNNVFMPSYIQSTLPSSATTKNDYWNFTVSASDGSATSIAINSGMIYINNTAPVISGGSLTLSSNVKTTDNLIASWLATDSDPIDTLTYYITWYLTGVPQFSEYVASTSAILQSGNTTKGDQWSFEVRAFDNTDNSSWINLGSTVTILNTAPITGNLTISIDPTTLDNISISWDYYDIDSDERNDSRAIIEWYKNGEIIGTLTNSSEVSYDQTTKNEAWWYKISVSDGYMYSTVLESTHIKVVNTAPINTTSLPLPIKKSASDGIIVNVTDMLNSFSDPDIVDIIQVVQIQWFVSGTQRSEWDGELSIPINVPIKGEVWSYSIIPFDGLDLGLRYNSSEFVIENSLPLISNIAYGSTTVYTTDNLEAIVVISDADDGDTKSVIEIKWYNYTGSWNHVPLYDGRLNLPASATKKGETWEFRLIVTDGEANTSITKPLIPVTILNSAPWIDSNSISIIGGSTTSDPLTVSYTFHDDDNDSEDQTEIIWESSIDYLTIYDNTLPSTETRAGEIWWVTIRPGDGSALGDLYNSKAYGIKIIIGNTQPMILSADIQGEYNSTTVYGSSFGTVFDLVINYTAWDRDGDEGVPDYDVTIVNTYAIGSKYTWYVIRDDIEQEMTAFKDKTSVLSSATIKGDIWYALIEPRDFYGDYGVSFRTSNITIGNTVPQLDVIVLNKNNYYTTDSIGLIFTRDVNWRDYDVYDTIVEFNVTWYLYNDSSSTWIYYSEYDDLTSLPSSATTKHDIWLVTAAIYDGQTYSLEKSKTISILNTKPVITLINLNPESPNTTENLMASWNYFDADNDSQELSGVIIYWYKNALLVPELTNLTAVDHLITNRDESWYYIISVYDNEEYSANRTSNTISVINLKPTVLEVTVNGYLIPAVTTVNNLAIDWVDFQESGFSDLDDDSIFDYKILWYLNGILQVELNDSRLISSSLTIKSQIWSFSIRIRDPDNNSGIWSDWYNSSEIRIINAIPSISNHQFIDNEFQSVFLVEDENLILDYLFSDPDDDINRSKIEWYLNGTLMTEFTNLTTISAESISPGDFWEATITPYDGEDLGTSRTINIYVESRSNIDLIGFETSKTMEGEFIVWSFISDENSNTIESVEYKITIDSETSLTKSAAKNGSGYWKSFFTLTEVMENEEISKYIGTILNLSITVKTITGNKYDILYRIINSTTARYTLVDNAAPRINDAWYEVNKKSTSNSGNFTFYADISDYGSGVSEVFMKYYFEEVATNTTNGQNSTLKYRILQNIYDRTLILEYDEQTGLWTGTVPFRVNGTTIKPVYQITAIDSNGYGDGFISWDSITQSSGGAEVPPYVDISWMVYLAAFVALVMIIGSVVYMKFIRKPVGLDKNFVLNAMKKVTDTEIRLNLDSHSLGIVVAYFDQRHGPVPIIVDPEILKDNFQKLIDLADRSFSTTGFVDNFKDQRLSNFNFNLGPGLKVESISIGFALNRPSSRGGADNITMNILVIPEVYPLINQFTDVEDFQKIVKTVHGLMDKKPDEKDRITKEVKKMRKFITKVILGYEKAYKASAEDFRADEIEVVLDE